MPRRFRKLSRVQLSAEGREKQVAAPTMKGVVLRQAHLLVTVKEDGAAGNIFEYHEDFLETVPGRSR